MTVVSVLVLSNIEAGVGSDPVRVEAVRSLVEVLRSLRAGLQVQSWPSSGPQWPRPPCPSRCCGSTPPTGRCSQEPRGRQRRRGQLPEAGPDPEEEKLDEVSLEVHYIYHLPLDHLGLLGHAETPVVVSPLRAVVRLPRGGVYGRSPLRRASSSIVTSAPATVMTTSASTTRYKGLAWECSVAGPLRSIFR